MKRNFTPILLWLFLVNFTSNSLGNKLVGRWQISEIIVDDKKINLNLYPNCENKEKIEFNDSTFKWETYFYSHNHCFKDITKGTYEIKSSRDFLKKEWVEMLLTSSDHQSSISDYVIIEANDSDLKLRFKHENIVKCYKKIN